MNRKIFALITLAVLTSMALAISPDAANAASSKKYKRIGLKRLRTVQTVKNPAFVETFVEKAAFVESNIATAASVKQAAFAEVITW